jgi:hypothetical protein
MSTLVAVAPEPLVLKAFQHRYRLDNPPAEEDLLALEESDHDNPNRWHLNETELLEQGEQKCEYMVQATQRDLLSVMHIILDLDRGLWETTQYIGKLKTPLLRTAVENG